MFYPYFLVKYNHLNDGFVFKIYSKIFNNEYIYNRLSKKIKKNKNYCFLSFETFWIEKKCSYTPH